MKYLDSDGLLYFTQKIKTWLSGKVDKVDGKGLSTNDFTTTLKNKLDGISAGANVNVQADWNATSGDAFIKNKPTIPPGAKLYSATGQNTDGAMTQKAVTDALGGKANSSHTHDDRYYTESEVDTKLANKVDKVSGKGLSTNDFTTTLKNKLDGIASGAEVNVQANWTQTNTTADDYIKNKPSTFPPSTHDHDDRYYTESEVDAKIADAISGVTQFDYEVFESLVDLLGVPGKKGTIYLVPHQHDGSNDSYDEYVWVVDNVIGEHYEKIGNTDIDLSGYQTKITSSNKLAYSLISGTPDLSGYQTKITTSNKLAYSLISGTPNLSGYVQESNLAAITNAEIDTICS